MKTDIKYKTINVSKWFEIPKIGAYRAMFPSGGERWLVDGKFHRDDGPAVIRPDGDERYFLNGTQYQKSRYYKELYKTGLLSKKDYFIMLL